MFEGTEKKIELIVDPAGGSLRRHGDAFWHEVVAATGARVISRMQTPRCEAYLLSESSLFVFDDRLVMITCGQTRLPSAITPLRSRIPADQVRLFVYQRKNEVFPHSQPTSFFDDLDRLAGELPGVAYQFGEGDEHHLFVYHLDRPYTPDPDDATVEILMYDIDKPLRRVFDRGSEDTGEVRRRSGIDQLVAGYAVDDHLFEPRGYSLNAVKDDRYLTIHVTPDELGCYTSVETNLSLGEQLGPFVDRVLGLFRPRSFDLIAWEPRDAPDAPESKRGPGGDDYRTKAHVSQQLTCGYHVSFSSHYRPQRQRRRAIEIQVPRHVG